MSNPLTLQAALENYDGYLIKPYRIKETPRVLTPTAFTIDMIKLVTDHTHDREYLCYIGPGLELDADTIEKIQETLGGPNRVTMYAPSYDEAPLNTYKSIEGIGLTQATRGDDPATVFRDSSRHAINWLYTARRESDEALEADELKAYQEYKTYERFIVTIAEQGDAHYFTSIMIEARLDWDEAMDILDRAGEYDELTTELTRYRVYWKNITR